MRARTIAPALLLPLLLGGCIYERVDITAGSTLLNGTILSDYRTVEVRGSRIVLKPGARFAVRNEFVTQWIAQYDVRITEGDGMRLYLRTTPHELDTARSMMLRYAVDGCALRREGGELIPLRHNAETERQTLLIDNEADRLMISAECRRLFDGTTPAPSTEYLIFETLPGSTVEISSIAYFYLDGEN